MKKKKKKKRLDTNVKNECAPECNSLTSKQQPTKKKQHILPVYGGYSPQILILDVKAV